ncbi:MAG TPA: hypothetical protein VN962_11655 [Polyangia bacterium]|nr:hypothetical protein [Polyangia bacterium]
MDEPPVDEPPVALPPVPLVDPPLPPVLDVPGVELLQPIHPADRPRASVSSHRVCIAGEGLIP